VEKVIDGTALIGGPGASSAGATAEPVSYGEKCRIVDRPRLTIYWVGGSVGRRPELCELKRL
jgi:hypothetical protein